MKKIYQKVPSQRVLAIDPITKGFAFVILEENPLQLVDWGLVFCKRKRVRDCSAALQQLIIRYQPTAVVLEDPRSTRILRRRVLDRFFKVLEELVDGAAVAAHLYSRDSIRAAFSDTGALTRPDITKILATRFPELAHRLPRPRQIWQSEDARMSIFDALSLAVTHLAATSQPQRRAA